MTLRILTADPLKHPAALQEMIKKSGQLAVPVIDIGGHIIVGFQQGKLKELLNIV